MSDYDYDDDDITEEILGSPQSRLAPAASIGRCAQRYRVFLPVTVSRGPSSCTGVVADISTTGAKILETGLVVPEGARILVELSLYPDSAPVQIGAEVVRQTEQGGFAARFHDVDRRALKALNEVLPRFSDADTGALPTEGTSRYSGKFVARLGPTIQLACVEAARAAKLDINEWIKRHLSRAAHLELEQARRDHSCAEPDCPRCRAGRAAT